MRLTIRPWYLYGFLCGSFGLGLALYLQFAQGIAPCPLCVLTRIILIVLTMMFLMSFIHNPRHVGKWIYIVLNALIAAIGLAINIRHIWLQYLPAGEVPECGPGFDYLIQTFPLSTALSTMLKGSGECSEVVWKFLGLSLPSWAAIGFVILLIICVIPAFDRKTTP